MPEDRGSLRGIERTLGVRLERAGVSRIAMPELATTAEPARQSIARHANGGTHRKNSGFPSRKGRGPSRWRRGA